MIKYQTNQKPIKIKEPRSPEEKTTQIILALIIATGLILLAAAILT